MPYTGSIELLSGLKAKNNANFPLVDAKDVRINDDTRLSQKITELNSTISNISTNWESARPMIYCWGDSLTEGVGGYVMQVDNLNAYMTYSYPAWVGQTYDVVNLGARSENVQAIMARQGADPIVFQTSFTIPASSNTPVKVATIHGLYNTNENTGFTNRSGDTFVKIHREVESPGVNPCEIAGVEGILYREITDSVSDEEDYDYYFKRLKDGEAVTVPVGTELETYAMKNYRNGIAIIWMGANGGGGTATEFATKIKSMVTYGNYLNYLVIISREFPNSTNLATVKAELTDDDGFCHVIDLMEQLPYRGYGLAGIPLETINTSAWITTDLIKKNMPLLCEYITGKTGEEQFGELHYSSWGYKAIGKLVVEKLGEMGLVSGSITKGADNTNKIVGSDDYGDYWYKLAQPIELDGTAPLDTKVRLYKNVKDDWTFVLKWNGPLYAPGIVVNETEYHHPQNVFCCTLDNNKGSYRGILFRYVADDSPSGMIGYNNSFSPVYNGNRVDNWEGRNICIITKEDTTYSVYFNNYLVSTINSEIPQSEACTLPLIIGGRYNINGAEINFCTQMTVEDCRIYNSALEVNTISNLYNELNTAQGE